METDKKADMARMTALWSAETCLRFGCLAGLSARQSRVQRLGVFPRVESFDGDKSPAKSADKSAHSKALCWLRRAGFIRVHPSA